MFYLTNDLNAGNKASVGISISALKLILFILVLAGNIQTSAQNFFPLQIANSYLREKEKHFYGYSYSSGNSWNDYQYTYDSTQVIDTIRFENKLFYKYRDYYYHLDDTENKLYIKIGNESKLAVDFSAPAGLSDTLYFNNEARQYQNSGVYIDTVFGSERKCYKISRTIVVSDPVWTYPQEVWYYRFLFVDGIGLYEEIKNYKYDIVDSWYYENYRYINMLNHVNGNYFVELRSPENIKIFLGNNFNVKLTWTHNQPIINGFTIERKRNDELDYSSIKYLPKDSLVFVDTTLEPGYKYYYRIRANKAGYLSNPHEPVSMVTFKPPEMLYADTTVIDQVSIYWAYNYSDYDGFIVYRKEHLPNTNPLIPPWTEYTILDSVSADARSYTDSNVHSSLYYMYRVSVYKDSVISVPSGQLFISPQLLPPKPPINLNYSFTSDEGIIINWKNANHYATNYTLEKRTVNPLSEFQVVNDSTLADTIYIDFNILQLTKYEYRVKCYDILNTSTYSDTISIMSPEFQPILAPGNCYGFQTDSGTVVIEWDDNSSNESGFIIKYFLPNSGWITTGTTNMNTERFEHPQPASTGLLVTYQVSAYNHHNHSSVVEFFVKVVTSVDDESKNTLFDLSNNYPNPFNPSTKIKYSIPNHRNKVTSTQRTKLIVYDILGNQVAVLVNELKSPGIYEVDFDGSNLSSGVYIYRLTYGSYTESKKMILLK